MSKVIAYLRVSTDNQDLDNQRLAILDYANSSNLIIDQWFQIKISSKKSQKERLIDDLLLALESGDTLIVSELSRLGRSVGQVITIMDELIQKRVTVIVIKQGMRINGKRDIATTTLITMLGLFAEIERELISERTRMGLAKAKAEGKLVGRPRGSWSSRLSGKEEEIRGLLEKRVSRASIAKIVGVSWPSLQHFIRSRRITP